MFHVEHNSINKTNKDKNRERENMKKPYQLTLDIDSTELVKGWLASKNLTLSGWVNGLIQEVAAELEGEESWMRKPAAELTLQEFGEGLSRWLKKIKETEAE